MTGTGLSEAGRFVTHAQHRVTDVLIGPRFGDAAMGLERYHNLSGTYDGASVASDNLKLAWANDASYCLEGVSQEHGAQHLLGPRGRVAAGACPHWGF